MQDLSKIADPYDITDLLALTAREYQGLDARVTAPGGIENRGDRIVIVNKTTGKDISVALNDFEVEALMLRISTRFGRERCNLHKSRPNFWVVIPPSCTCAVVFASRLNMCRLLAYANATLDSVVRFREEAERFRGMTDAQIDEALHEDKVRDRFVRSELRRLKA
jgi:hypothetical protein